MENVGFVNFCLSELGNCARISEEWILCSNVSQQIINKFKNISKIYKNQNDSQRLFHNFPHHDICIHRGKKNTRTGQNVSWEIFSVRKEKLKINNSCDTAELGMFFFSLAQFYSCIFLRKCEEKKKCNLLPICLTYTQKYKSMREERVKWK